MEGIKINASEKVLKDEGANKFDPEQKMEQGWNSLTTP